MSAYLTNAIGLAIIMITLAFAALTATAAFQLFRREEFKGGFVAVGVVLVILIVASALSRNLFVPVP